LRDWFDEPHASESEVWLVFLETGQPLVDQEPVESRRTKITLSLTTNHPKAGRWAIAATV